MIRFAFLVALLAPASALAQTADVLREVVGLRDPVEERTISTVTYDLTKIVKGNPDLNGTDKVLKKLADYGTIHEPGDIVTILPKNRVTVRTNLAAHDEIQRDLNAWAVKPAPAPPELPVVRGLVPPGRLPPPVGGFSDGIRSKPDKKKR